jgi:hypothetical protein
MNQNFDDCSGAERNLSDGPGRSEETCCKQFEARETDDRPGDFSESGSVEDTLPLSSQFSEVERLTALKSGTAQFNYTGSSFDDLWQYWIDNKDWDSMSLLFMEGAAGLSLTFLSGVDQNCTYLIYLLHRLLKSLGCEKVGSYFELEENTQGLGFTLHLVMMLGRNFSGTAHLAKGFHQPLVFALNRRLVSHRFKEAIIPIIVQMGS